MKDEESFGSREAILNQSQCNQMTQMTKWPQAIVKYLKKLPCQEVLKAKYLTTLTGRLFHP